MQYRHFGGVSFVRYRSCGVIPGVCEEVQGSLLPWLLLWRIGLDLWNMGELNDQRERVRKKKEGRKKLFFPLHTIFGSDLRKLGGNGIDNYQT